jgi:hypothetical protein
VEAVPCFQGDLAVAGPARKWNPAPARRMAATAADIETGHSNRFIQ